MLGGNDSCNFDLNTQLSASVKKILLQRINFKEAQRPDDGDTVLHKYKPLNAGYKPGQIRKQSMDNSLNQNDIPKPSVVLFPEEKIELQWKDTRRIGPGLANLGNTCFLNSVLQVLTYTPPLANYILSGEHKNKCQSIGFCMQCELVNHITRALHNKEMGALRPMSIIQKLRYIGKTFKYGRQEDAHEFLRYVVEGIQKSDYAGKQLDKPSKETTVANAIFGGYYRSQVKCLHCQFESNTFDPMMDMNLDIKDCSNIISSLQKSVRLDRLDGENKYFCEKCRTKRVAQKRGTIHKEPNVLTLQLKRFNYSKMFGGKISKDVSFPEELNIRPFMSNPQGEAVLYTLYGVLVHSGYSCNSGHYYCYVKASNSSWYEMNDNRVCQVGLHVVKNAQAYLLFYVKKKVKPKVNRHVPLVKHQTAKESPLLTNLIFQTNAQNTMSSMKNSDSLGAPVKRKVEPKIIWNNQAKSSTTSSTTAPSINKKPSQGTAESVLKEKVIKLSAYAEFSSLQNKTSVDTNNAASVTTKKGPNSLQKLSLSYGDTDSANSSATPSPVLYSTPNKEDVSRKEINISLKEKNSDENGVLGIKTSLPLHLHSDLSKDAVKTSPLRLKLNHGKHFTHHNGFNVWSPITKGALHPRVIINRCISETAVDKGTPEKQNKDKTWNEDKLDCPDGLFGPMMPPPSSVPKRQRNNSITSEASSTASIQSQSGEWDIQEKQTYQPSTGIIPQRQHVGWDVSKTMTTNTTSLIDQIDNDTNKDTEVAKQKRKKKKKKTHDPEEVEPLLTDDTWVEMAHKPEIRKRKHSPERCSKNRRADDFESTQNESVSDTPKKKKKKKKRKKHKHETRDDESCDSLTVDLSPPDALEEKSKKKKKKKKHKRKHSSLQDEDEKEVKYNFPSNITDDTLQRLKEKKRHLSIRFPKNDTKYDSFRNDISKDNPSDGDIGSKQKKKLHSKHAKKSSSDASSDDDSARWKRSSHRDCSSGEHMQRRNSDKWYDNHSKNRQTLPDSRQHRRHVESRETSADSHYWKKESNYSKNSSDATSDSNIVSSSKGRLKSRDTTPSSRQAKPDKKLSGSSRESSPDSYRIRKGHGESWKTFPEANHKKLERKHSNKTSNRDTSPNKSTHHKQGGNTSQGGDTSWGGDTSRETKYINGSRDSEHCFERHGRDRYKKSDGRSSKHVSHDELPESNKEYIRKGEDRIHDQKQHREKSEKKEVPCHAWDEEKKKVNTWDGSTKSSTTVDYLLNGSTKVSSWDGTDESGTYKVINKDDAEKEQDEWDEEYDTGKLKKRKVAHIITHDSKKSNAFQHLQDYRNHAKDQFATHRSPTKHTRQNHRSKFKTHS